MITALIFDCYGVLVTDGWQPFKSKHFGHQKALFEQATDLNKQANAGMLSYEDFIAELAELAQLPTTHVRQAIDSNAPNEALFALITKLSKQYKIGMLSNTGSNWQGLFSEGQLELFDATALSYETGMIKPERQAYEHIADRLGVSPEECVFVDDQERFCTAARDAGMKAIWYQNFEQFEADLTKLGVS